ncbi:cysteine peptidase family C39 domain-containing protein [Hespellia stercorisuis]|uniref:Peptidase_C39 like family protein n=1 Tax=Hespellia stercorisuis DSM 15480 TaxID=1121950 RepID=A0A1M6SLB6_9FIRM|nr:hypothetical protein [Hespellia stercorisuis]SHK45399.1 hypothetical protein SAMN02745243_02976 [Hespellia stercorisuis DSM 15480]
MNAKKIVIRVGVLAAVFIVAAVIISLITNRNSDERTSEMATAVLPRISFDIEGHTVNSIAGYVDEMDITAMRDTITPIANDGTLTMKIESYDNEIKDITYVVTTLDGETKLGDGTAEEKDGTVTLNVRSLIEDVPEAVMEVTLKAGSKDVHYYMRIEKPESLSTKACLDFAEDFHNNTLDKNAESWVSSYIETSDQSDNTTYQTVTINSEVSQVMWGNLTPTVKGDIEWTIKESNSTYTSLLARYQVTCPQDDNPEGTETYNVKEFFRIRIESGAVYLLNYNRTMNQVFDGRNNPVLTKDGIKLGITDPAVEYKVSKNGKIVAFVQERELWVYNQDDDQLSMAFSFANSAGADARSRYDQHAVRIISMDKNGSTTFAVYGYMNRGKHEGEVGVDIFYFDIEKNVVEEKAFIPSNKSFALAEDELGKFVYYNHNDQMLYVLAGGTLYQVDLKNDEQTELAKNLTEGQYVGSADGHLLAYQTNGELNSATKVTVMNLSDGNVNEIEVNADQCIRPLGFVVNDFVYGIANVCDAGVKASGEAILPMAVLEIRDSENEVVKTYAQEQIFVEDIFINENLITLNRAVKNGDIYTDAGQDYITNNEEKTESNISLTSYVNEVKKTEMLLAFTENIPDTLPKILQPGQVTIGDVTTIAFTEKDTTEKYLVFGTGEVAGIYGKAAYAIARAQELCGVVISSRQQYVWEKGNRDLVFQTGFPAFSIPEGKTSLQACEEQLAQYGATRVDLTGCDISQICYLIYKGIPVIAMTDANNAILLTGYTTEDVTYIDPATGEEKTADMADMAAMVAGSGNTFIGYVR